MIKRSRDFYQDGVVGMKNGICFFAIFSFFLFIYSIIKSALYPLTEIEVLISIYAWNISIVVVLHTLKSLKEDGITNFMQIITIVLGCIVLFGGMGIYIYGWF